MVQLLCNYGKLKSGRAYETGESGTDRIMIGRLYVPLTFVVFRT